MSNNIKALTLFDRLRNAWNAFKGSDDRKVGSLHFGLDIKRCDKCVNVIKPDVLYLCDRKYCFGGCENPECKHTHDINHAVNFKKCEGDSAPYYEELERPIREEIV